MKKNIKRTVSMLLVLCSLLSLLPMTVIATGQESVPEKIVYDFVVKDTDLVDTNNKSLGNGILTVGPVKNAIDAYYAAGTLNWKFAANNYSLLQTATNTVADCSFFGGSSYPWQGLRTGVNIKDGDANTYPAGYWVAMTIKIPAANTYNLTLNYQTRSDGAKVGEVFLLEGAQTDAAAIDAALIAQNRQLSIDFSAGGTLENLSATAADVTLAAGEYTVVFRATEMKEKATCAYLFLNNLTLEVPKVEPPKILQVKELEYNFSLNTTNLTYGDNKSFAGATMNGNATKAIENYYREDKIFWKHAGNNMEALKTESNEVYTVSYFGGASYPWSGLRLGVNIKDAGTSAYPAGYWEAFTIASPGKGKYQLTLDYQTRSGATPKGEVYLIKGTFKKSADIEAAMTEANLLKTIKFKSNIGDMTDKQVNLGLHDLEQGEYTLVFKAVEGENSGSYIYINKLTAEHESILPPPGPKEVTYDFAVTHRDNGIYDATEVSWEGYKADLAQRYEKGELTWKPEQKAATLTYDVSFKRNGAMTSYSNADDWFAVRCKTPGTGIYTLTMNHSASSNGALGAVYILPGDTENIEAAMDHSNRVKKVAFYNESGDANVKDGSVTTLGTWEFGTEEEFILVFEAYDNSPFSNYAYLWISQVIAKEGDYVEDTSDSRQINSIVVNENAVKTYETCQYGTTAVVNGQDYLFVPIEGKKLVIYNMDDMVKVNTIRTPFPICRGITTDKDGIIWLVGDKPVVFRYDPVTEVSSVTRNFGAQIPHCYGGFSCTTDDEGNLYMGTYQEAHIVKYIPSTDTFVNIGQFNDDAMFSCGVIIKDNYLYVGITGDRNGDGLRTTEMLKIDLTTNECVDRLDITQQVGPDEVMVRGTGIGGDTLFVGGIQMDAFIAIDLSGEKMQLKQYEGFRKQISYCGTEEYNGKIYFTTGDYGLCEYDIASDTITPLKMETAVYGLRCAAHSLITLDDPLYPGKTIVTYRSEGIILYNPQSKQANYIVDMLDEENDGSGMNIISMANGLPGTNEIYLGAFNTRNCTAIDLRDGSYKHEFEAIGAQTDVMLWYEGVLYTGNYTNGALVRINTENKDRNVVLLSMNNDTYEQNRVHALAAGDGFLFGGTMPRTDTYDGCLAVVKLDTLDYWVERNIVDGCSVTGLAYANGLVFGSTSYSGGTGTDGPKNDTISAKIFVYDPITRKKVGELDPRDYFSGLPQQVPYIDAIAVDPDYTNNGRVWAMVSETLFCFTFNKDTGKFDVTEVLSYSLTDFPGNNNRYARATQILFKNGWLYVAMGNKGGLHKVNLSNFEDHARLNCVTPRCFLIAEDGNIYYSIGDAELHMYPLDVTEEDWQAAEAVDAKIKAIGAVSLQSEAAIDSARQAYDALSLKHKALIQNYDILQIAETDLLEAKIDAIGTVNKDSKALIDSLQATYNALPAKEQKYVKNYSELVKARKAAQAIEDTEKAAAVQKLVDGLASLGEITLEKEPQVVAVREAYDALSFIQKSMVNIDRLVAAEAKIKALRQEKIDYLKQLIAGIGEVTLEDEAAITEALALWDWLHLNEREQIDYVTLNAASRALTPLQKEAAAAVDALILAIGDSIDHSSKDAIEAARKAYDALTPGAKQYVQNLELLTGAEALYAELGMNPTTLIIIVAVAGGVLLAAAAVIVVLVLKKKKAAAGEETPSGVEAEAEEVPVDPEV